MKKPDKAALKKRKAAPVAPAAKKPAAKKPAVVKAAAKKPVAKKPAMGKASVKAPAKALAKKPVVAVKKPAVVHKPGAAKKSVAAPLKAAAKKPQAHKAIAVKGKSQGGLQKKIQDKIAASKKISLEKAAQKASFDKKAHAKKLEEQKKAEKLALAKEKLAEKEAKEAKKLEAKKEKHTVKETVKAPKKLSKKEEKALSKGKRNESFEEEGFEESETRKGFEDEEEEDDFDVTPQKVKMTFDEDIEDNLIPARKKNKASSLDEDIKESLAEEILALAEDFSIDEVFSSIRNMDLFKIETDECVVRGCDNPATTAGYCRYHYIKLWKDIQKKQLILSEGRLAKIIEDLVRKYPIKFIETIIQDLADDKAFNSVLKDLDIETDEAEIEGFDDDELLDDDQDIAFETKVVKPSFDD